LPFPVTRDRADDHSSRGVRCRTPRATYPETSDGPPSIVSLFGLAPDGVYLAFPVTRETGALLPHRFTLTGSDPVSRSRPAVCSLLHFPSRHR